MRNVRITSCLTGLAIIVLLGACAAQVDDSSSSPLKDIAQASDLATASTPATADTISPKASSCATAYCTSNATCESACHEASSKCLADHHCYVP